MKRGFTLIELLIVIAVISILIGIALPRFRGMREEGLITQAKGELRTLQTAIESYYIHNNAYPTDSATWQTELINARPKIVGITLIDPFSTTNAQYQLVYDTNTDHYAIYSVGPDGDGGVDTVSTEGVVTESNGDSCIFVANGDTDTTP